MVALSEWQKAPNALCGGRSPAPRFDQTLRNASFVCTPFDSLDAYVNSNCLTQMEAGL